LKHILQALQVASIEVFVALLCLVSGLPILISPTAFAPTAVLALMPLWLVLCWGVCLTLGGLADLIGIATENLYIRRAGLILLSAGSLVMAMGVLSLTGSTRLFVAGTYLVFGWATAARYYVIGKSLKSRRERWRKAAKKQEE
jgi:hypothetical protein